jgi:hypothetical protein
MLFVLEEVRSDDGGRYYTAPHFYLGGGGMKRRLVHFMTIFLTPMAKVLLFTCPKR